MAAAFARGCATSLTNRPATRPCCAHSRPQSACRDLSLNLRRRCSRRADLVRLNAAAEADAETEAADQPVFEDEDDGVGLTTHQVEQFLSTLCEDTEIAELELKMGSFSMKVRRSLSGGGGSNGNGGSPTASFSPVATQSFDFYPPTQTLPPSPNATQSTTSLDEEDDSESLVLVEAPKVGVLRRGKYVKGKKVGKGTVVEEGDTVKKGQHVAYVEQLGTFVPVESPQAGEIVNFLVEDGKPVEYGETVVELAPFFGGHIIGDQKYA